MSGTDRTMSDEGWGPDRDLASLPGGTGAAPTRWRKLPVEIEARHYAGGYDLACEIALWCAGKIEPGFDREKPLIEIETLEGTMTARPSDWVIRGVAGEFYPCRDDVFRATYEAAPLPFGASPATHDCGCGPDGPCGTHLDRSEPDGASRIAAERARQVGTEGWTAEHDAQHDRGELARAAACYALKAGGCLHGAATDHWPWHRQWWNPTQDPVRMLEKAGALIAAEIDRLLAAQVNP